jgi:hypothetical protein
MKTILRNELKKEVRTMKKCTVLTVALIAAIAFFAVTAHAVTDRTVSVTASASIAGSTSLSRDVTSLTYGTTNADAFPTLPADSGKITLTYTSNYNPWKIMVYTDNTQIPLKADTNGRYAKGGLVAGSGPYNVTPLKWITKNPASAAPVVPAGDWTTKYNFVLDKRDEDDPDTAAYDESWGYGYANGYPNIAWGPVTGGGGVCVDPTNTAAGPNRYRGEAINGSVAVYIAGMFLTGGTTTGTPASAGDYSGTIYFDLYHP